MSAATSSGLRPSLMSFLASLPVVVVFPEPWRPTIMMPLTWPLGLSAREVSTGPMRASSSSWQILTNQSPAETLRFLPAASEASSCTTSPMDFSRTRATNFLTTSNATSASSSETRMSLRDASTISSVISAFPASRFLAARNPLVTVSSMGRPITPCVGRWHLPVQGRRRLFGAEGPARADWEASGRGGHARRLYEPLPRDRHPHGFERRLPAPLWGRGHLPARRAAAGPGNTGDRGGGGAGSDRGRRGAGLRDAQLDVPRIGARRDLRAPAHRRKPPALRGGWDRCREAAEGPRRTRAPVAGGDRVRDLRGGLRGAHAVAPRRSVRALR